MQTPNQTQTHAPNMGQTPKTPLYSEMLATLKGMIKLKRGDLKELRDVGSAIEYFMYILGYRFDDVMNITVHDCMQRKRVKKVGLINIYESLRDWGLDNLTIAKLKLLMMIIDEVLAHYEQLGYGPDTKIDELI